MIHKSISDIITKINKSSYSRASTQYVKSKGWHDIIAVEIGVREGYNALNMLRTLDIKTLYLIDPYITYRQGEKVVERNRYLPYGDTEFNNAKELLSQYNDKTVWIRKTSDDAVNDIPNVDFVYIDGNHDYEFVKRDLQNYFPKTKLLAGHDWTNVGVARAVIEFTLENGLYDRLQKISNERGSIDWVILNDSNEERNSNR